MSQIGSRPGFAFTGWRSAALVVFVLLAANLTLLLGDTPAASTPATSFVPISFSSPTTPGTGAPVVDALGRGRLPGGL